MVNQPIGNDGLGIFGVVRFDFESLLQGQARIAKLKSVYKLLFYCVNTSYPMDNC